jgi:hypothetical protein
MAEENTRLVRPQIRSPRSAAIAGIVYSVLMTIGMLLVRNMVADVPADISQEWLDSWSNKAITAVTIVPFAGIAFLWFTGVIRDRLGDMEDRFLATVFLSSGIISVVLLFVWGAIVGALFGTYAASTVLAVDTDVVLFGFALMNQIIGNYALRMSSVYMLSIASIWTRTGVMPRWLSIVTYVVALGFLLFAGTIREARFAFPIWVFVVSIYILVVNYRRTHHHSSPHS